MNLRIGENDGSIFEWAAACQACTARQLALVQEMPETSMRRRLGQFVGEGFLTVSPPVTGLTGQAEREYCVTAANRRKLLDAAPWIEVQATKPWKQEAVPHRRAINDFRIALEMALRGQDYYSYRFFPHYHYDTADPDAPTCIKAPDCRRRSPADAMIMADFALVVSCRESGMTKSSLLYGEIDTGREIIRSTLRQRPTLETKMAAYASFVDVEGYRHIGKVLGAEFSGCRVLIVTKSQRRVTNIQRICSALGSTEFVWITSLDRISPQTVLGPIWETGEGQQLRRLLRHCNGQGGR